MLNPLSFFLAALVSAHYLDFLRDYRLEEQVEIQQRFGVNEQRSANHPGKNSSRSFVGGHVTIHRRKMIRGIMRGGQGIMLDERVWYAVKDYEFD